MKIAVITPYHDVTSPYLAQCLDSVAQQTYENVVHITVGDGCDLTNQFPNAAVENIVLPKRTQNYGDSPRSVGVVYAFSTGVDAVLFLDSDNWYEPHHIANMVKTQQTTGAEVVTCRRKLAQLDGTTLGLCKESDGIIFCDTNCLMVMRSLAEEAGLWWLIPDNMHVIDDRVVWDTLIHATGNIHAADIASIYYRTAFRFHYEMFNVEPPNNCKLGEEIAAFSSAINQFQFRAKKRAELRFAR